MQSDAIASRKYFNHLDSLRFFSFCLVFFAHLGTIFFNTPLANSKLLNNFREIALAGTVGVNFFFVLSGFLITYLLLKEKQKNNKISIKKFYIRRILRIWPLFFLVLFSSYYLFPLLIPETTVAIFHQTHTDFSLKALIYYVFFIGNVYEGLQIGLNSLSMSILWSVCAEEQFYLIWPWIIKYLNPKKILIFLYSLILLSFIYKAYYVDDWFKSYFMPFSTVMDFAFGGLLGTYYYLNKLKKIVSFSFLMLSSCMFIFGLVILFDSTLTIHTLKLLKSLALDSFFILTIVTFIHYELVFNKIYLIIKKDHSIYNRVLSSMIRYGYRIFNYLGKISYGLYIYHTMCMMFTLHILYKFGLISSPTNTSQIIILGILAFTLSITVASISYHKFEMKILSLKEKFY